MTSDETITIQYKCYHHMRTVTSLLLLVSAYPHEISETGLLFVQTLVAKIKIHVIPRELTDKFAAVILRLLLAKKSPAQPNLVGYIQTQEGQGQGLMHWFAHLTGTEDDLGSVSGCGDLSKTRKGYLKCLLRRPVVVGPDGINEPLPFTFFHLLSGFKPRS